MGEELNLCQLSEQKKEKTAESRDSQLHVNVMLERADVCTECLHVEYCTYREFYLLSRFWDVYMQVSL